MPPVSITRCVPVALPESDKKMVLDFFHEVNDSTRSLKSSNLASIYDRFGATYDKIVNIIAYCGKEQLIKTVETIFEGEDLSKQLIIDIGAGTGILGEGLKQQGFKHIHGLDLSKEMLEMSRQKSVYEKIFNVPLTTDPIPDVTENTYNAAVSAGSFIEGHIKMDALRELARVVKKDGYIVYTLHDPKFTMGYMEVQSQLMKEKVVELISMTLAPYKREWTLNFEYVYCYIVVLKVLV